MKHSSILVALLILMPGSPAMADGGGGTMGGGSMPQSQRVKLTPEQKAAASYQAGLKHRDRAMQYEEEAATETRDKQLANLEKKIQKEYERAIDDFEKANGYLPGLYEIHSDLGFALRKVGRFEESLAAYNTSLSINPTYGNAIEYRGEAYLGLNRIADAKDAYMQLFQRDPGLAETLLKAMNAWVESRRADPKGLDTSEIEQFAAWVQQRTELASFVRPTDDEALARWAESS